MVIPRSIELTNLKEFAAGMTDVVNNFYLFVFYNSPLIKSWKWKSIYLRINSTEFSGLLKHFEHVFLESIHSPVSSL